MFSTTCLQNQVYLPLTHILSTFTSARPSVTRPSAGLKTGQQREAKSHYGDASDRVRCIVCVDSFDNAVCNFTEVDTLIQGALNGTIRSSYLRWIDEKIPPNPKTTWRVSHVSTESFFENKHGFAPLMSSPQTRLFDVHLLVSRKNQRTHYIKSPWGHTIVRGFKTDDDGRSVGGLNSENIRSQTSSSSGGGGSGRSLSRIFPFKSWRTYKGTSKAIQAMEAGEQSEKLKTILAESNLTVDEQQKIKVAFAEGYLASDGRTRQSSNPMLVNIFRVLSSIALIIAVLLMILGGPFRLPIGRNNSVHPEEISVTFDDVQGVTEAKQELQEIVEFLKNPDKFSSLGGKLPKGVLLVGPPGTGKTLLARAVAGEAAVPFFHAAGPEFDEVLVGQGARRVRDLFNTAKARAPCVIFIDEIDSVGAKRTNSVLHPYANQTINQLLSEMDGFRQNEGVIVLGATNRREDLDKALLRPGRFDVEVQVPIPDLESRKEILDFYLSKIKTAMDVDRDVLARGTTGFTGADIENLVNQAAIRAAVDKAASVSMKYLENARDKVLMGPERKSRIPDEEANLITAYHEGGHAIVALFTKYSHPLHKVTIIPRGPSLGHTAYIPEKERYHVTKAQMLAMMDTLMGGRAAEELIFGSDKITSGASSDLKQATALATQMVKEWGMSEKVGVRTFEDESGPLIVVKDTAQSTCETIDAEIKSILTESYERAKTILKSHSKEHKLLAEALLKYETLDAEDLKKLLNGSKVTRQIAGMN